VYYLGTIVFAVLAIIVVVAFVKKRRQSREWD
jgi:hypothetical protein